MTITVTSAIDSYTFVCEYLKRLKRQKIMNIKIEIVICLIIQSQQPITDSRKRIKNKRI